MYKVLYRKYRPQYFADVVGQPQVTVTLKNELMRGRIAHAYLFTGSRGTGKTTCAKILARAVNCLHPKDGDPCGECEICRGLEDGSILDVVEIDAASNNGVDSIRSLIEESNFTPATARYRVYIIDEVHMLSVAAFNALLKTLEEPPPHVIFILATTEVHKLLPTILSRCQRFDFKRIAPEDIAGRLEDVAQRENAQLDHDAALLIARVADGALRDALSLLDQCLGRDRHVTLDIVNQTAGVAARDYLAALAQDIVHQDPAADQGERAFRCGFAPRSGNRSDFHEQCRPEHPGCRDPPPPAPLEKYPACGSGSSGPSRRHALANSSHALLSGLLMLHG